MNAIIRISWLLFVAVALGLLFGVGANGQKCDSRTFNDALKIGQDPYAQPTLEPNAYQVNWEEARVDIASEVLAGMLASSSGFTNNRGERAHGDEELAEVAVDFADALIVELKKPQ